MSLTVDTQFSAHSPGHRPRRTNSTSPSPTRSTSSPSKRASSPNKLRSLIEQGVINEESPSYVSAMEKIYECSWKFDRSKDEAIIKSLDNRELDPDQFRQILYSGMNCKLTNSEFAAIRPLLDNGGHIDGAEFILLFYRLRFEHRAKHLKERIIADKQAYKSIQSEGTASAATANTRKPISLTDFTAEDLQSAERKVMEGAVRYDRLMPGASPLDGFDVESMDAAEFHATLRAVFHIKLTVSELSAYVLTHHNERGTHRVNCANFLLNFFRNGFLEKTRRLKQLWAKKKDVETRRLLEQAEKDKAAEKKNALQVDFAFSEADRRQALVKLRTAAKLYDKTTPGAMSMKAFEVKEMPPHVFKEQLKRIFNLKVTPAEMGALMAVFDVNGDGVITCEEFTKVFLNMGFEEREKELKAFRQQQADLLLQQQQRQRQAQADLDSFHATKVAFSFTDDEWEAAMFKLKEAAWRFDRSMPSAPSLEAFEQKSMPAHELKDQLKRVFHLKLSPQELGAIMQYFDADASGAIDCAHFLKKFLRLGYEERLEKTRFYRQTQLQTQARREALAAAKRSARQAQQNAVLAHGSTPPAYSEEDFQSAFSQLRAAAVRFHKASPSAASLAAFEARSMPVHVFRDQLKRVFHVSLSLPELFAVAAAFACPGTGTGAGAGGGTGTGTGGPGTGVGGTGTGIGGAGVPGSGTVGGGVTTEEVDCARFVISFLQLGYSERDRLLRDFRAKQREEAPRGLSPKAKERRGEEEGGLPVFTEQDVDRLLEKLIQVAAHPPYPRSQAASGGATSSHLAVFQAAALTPREVRQVLRTVYHLAVTDRELAACVSLFDLYQRGAVHVQTFLNTLLLIRFQFQTFQGGRAEEVQWMEGVRDGLKRQYTQRLARQSSSSSSSSPAEGKPWRSSTSLGSFESSGVYKRRGQEPPRDPLHKLLLRLLVARRTHRLDLSCRATWDPTPEDQNANPDPSHPAHYNNSTSMRGEGPLPASSMMSASLETMSLASQQTGTGTAVTSSSAKWTATGGGGSAASQPSSVLAWEVCLAAVYPSPSPSPSSPSKPHPQGGGADPEEGGSLHQLPIGHAYVDFRLHSLPADVFKLTELRELWLDNHRLTSLPRRVGELAGLQVLSLRHNLLTSLPAEVCHCLSLRRLLLAHNQLTALPNLLGRLQRLQEVDLAHNLLADFPEVLTALPRLHTLRLADNPLTHLPPQIASMRGLYLLDLQGVRFGSGSGSGSESGLEVLGRMPQVEVVLGEGEDGIVIVPGGGGAGEKRAARPWRITPAEEFELLGMIRGRAALQMAQRGRTRRG